MISDDNWIMFLNCKPVEENKENRVQNRINLLYCYEL
jgi:hypothetical protein